MFILDRYSVWPESEQFAVQAMFAGRKSGLIPQNFTIAPLFRSLQNRSEQANGSCLMLFAGKVVTVEGG